MCQRTPNNKATRINAGDVVNPTVLPLLLELRDHGAESLRHREKRRYVSEHDARRGEVRHGTNMLGQIHFQNPFNS